MLDIITQLMIISLDTFHANITDVDGDTARSGRAALIFKCHYIYYFRRCVTGYHHLL
jgi:hypothetical protein